MRNKIYIIVNSRSRFIFGVPSIVQGVCLPHYKGRRVFLMASFSAPHSKHEFSLTNATHLFNEGSENLAIHHSKLSKILVKCILVPTLINI